MSNLGMQILFVVFVTATVWSGAIAVYLGTKEENKFFRAMAIFFGFVASQSTFWSVIFLLSAMIGHENGSAASYFVNTWYWLFKGPGSVWWVVSVIGCLFTLRIKPVVGIADTIAMAWVNSVLLALLYSIVLLIISAIYVLGMVG